MAKQLRILIVEDVSTEAELAVRELKRAGMACEARRVETAPEFRRELDEFMPKVILSDFSMPKFDGMEALAIARHSRPDTPFIFVSGTLGEEYAIRALKNGATDYVLKNNLIRLPSAVERAINEAQERQARREAELELREKEERFRQLAENIREVFWMYSIDNGEGIYVSPAYEEIWGRPCLDVKSVFRDWSESIYPEDRERRLETTSKMMRGGIATDSQYRIVRPDGSLRWIHDRGFPVRDANGRVYRVAGIAEDITEREQAEQRLHESEAKYRGLIEQASDGIFVSDAVGNFLLVNSRGCELLGYTEGELIGVNGKITYLEEERESHTKRMERVRSGEVLRFERMVRRKDGSAFPAEVSLKMLDTGVVQVIFHDITQRRAQEQKIARLSRIQAVLSGINSAIVRIRDRQELFEEACRIAVEHGGFRMAWIGVVDKSAAKVNPVAWAGFENGFFGICRRLSIEEGVFEGEGTAGRAIRSKTPVITSDFETDPLIFYRKEHLERGYRSGVVLPLVTGGEAVGLLSLYAPEKGFFDDEEMKLLLELARDIAFALEYIEKEEKLNYLAYYDALTGLPNNTLFHDRLTQFVHAAKRGTGSVAAILINLDRFRHLNDTLGRHAGDTLLKMVAERLGTALREPFSLARTGGDSFAIAVADLKHDDDIVRMLRDRVFTDLDRPFQLNGEVIRISAKAGVVLHPRDGGDAETLFRNAEAALKQAKSTGDKYLFYAPEMNARIAEKLALENKLRRAIEREEFVLHYQPKINVADGRICGLEALIRWNDPESGLVPPLSFIPLLEETGLILQVGAWALKQAVSDYQALSGKGVACPRIAVNVSPLQLRQKDFAGSVADAIGWSRRQNHGVDLEITESVIMENIESNIAQLRAIRAMGVNVAVDDFGTGYSSLAYISKLPVNTLKIDRSFVKGMAHSPEDRNIVSTIISLAHSLNLKVVAEGVETEEQRNLLQRLQCDEMQGYLISAPVPMEQIEVMLGRMST
jgi:diguanylate cyclase (GGDEF)-like protein/PAS domain S-box-containing protein